MATRLSRTSLRPYQAVCYPNNSSLVPAGSSYAQSSIRLLTLTRLDDISVLYHYGLCASLYLYLSDLYIYWVGEWRWDDPHLQSTLQPP